MRCALGAGFAALALTLALTGCTGNDGGLQLPGGPKVVVSDRRAPSVTAAAGSLRVDQVARTSGNVAISLTFATGRIQQRISRYQVEVTTNTGQKVPMPLDAEREIPAFSQATTTLRVTLPEDGVQALRVAVGSHLAVAVPVPAQDGATVWRPAPLRQVGLKQVSRQSDQTNVVFDTIRSDGLVTEVTYHATVGDRGRLNVCAYNVQYDKCRIQEPDGTIHPLIGSTDEAAGMGGRSQGTLRFLASSTRPTRVSRSAPASTPAARITHARPGQRRPAGQRDGGGRRPRVPRRRPGLRHRGEGSSQPAALGHPGDSLRPRAHRDPDPPQASATLGQLEATPVTPQVTVTPAPPAPAPTGTATPTPAPVQFSVADIRPLPQSSSVKLPNSGSWLARQGATPAPAQDPTSEAQAQQSLKDLGAQRTPDGWVLTLPETVLFEYNKYDILPGADAKLTEVGTLLGHFPQAEIRVQGHTDSTSSADGNQTLSKNRADAMAKACRARA